MRNNPLKYIDPTGEKVELISRGVGNSKYNPGNHSLFKITPDNPEDFGVDHSFNFTLAGHDKGQLEGEFNNYGDVNLNPEAIRGTEIIKTPDGMTDTEFITKILYANNDLSGMENYNLSSFNLFGRNCNNYSTSLLEAAGSDLPNNYDPYGFDLGIGETTPAAKRWGDLYIKMLILLMLIF